MIRATVSLTSAAGKLKLPKAEKTATGGPQWSTLADTVNMPPTRNSPTPGIYGDRLIVRQPTTLADEPLDSESTPQLMRSCDRAKAAPAPDRYQQHALNYDQRRHRHPVA
jgi:hypothetical protein